MATTLLERAKPESSASRTKSSVAIHTIVGLAIMVVVTFLPAPAPITSVGMAVIGVFLGILYLWTFVDLVWPSILGITLSAFFIHSVMEPGEHGIWTALQESIGNWVVTFVIASLLLTHALKETGLIDRAAGWFLSRRWARKSPWAFTNSLFTCAFVLGLFLDLVPTVVFMIILVTAIFKKLGYTIGEKYPMVVIIGLTFLINIAFAITPISHPVTIIGMGVFSGVSEGGAIGFLPYMLVGVPVGVIASVLIVLFLRYGVRPNVDRFNDVDYSELSSTTAGGLDRRQTITAIVFAAVVLTWILPGIVILFDPQSAFVAYFDELTMIVPTLLGVVLLMMLRINGKALLDHSSSLREIPWGVIVLVACAMLFGTLLTGEAVGLTEFMVQTLSPMFAAGYSPFLMLTVLVIAIAVITQIANNVPVMIMFVSVTVPLAGALGVDERVVGTLVILAAQMGFALPSALASVALIFGNSWVKPSAVVRYGAYATLVSALTIALIGYPLSMMVFN